MNEKVFEKNLEQIAQQGIPRDVNLWPSVQTRLSRRQPRKFLPRLTYNARMKLLPRAAGALLALAAVILLTPATQAELMKLLDTIGGITFQVTDEYPGGDGPVTIIPTQYISLDEALEKYPFDLPTWTPEGFTLNQEVGLTFWPKPEESISIFLNWEQNGVNQLFLSIHSNTGEIVGPDSIETLDIEGREAALLRGGWNYNTKAWDPNLPGTSRPGMTILWAQEDLAYRLSTYGDDISVETLIQIVASMPE